MSSLPRRRRASAYERPSWLAPRALPDEPPEAAPRRAATWKRIPRRPLAALAAVIECAALGWLLTSPAFRATSVEVSGTTRVSETQVLSAAGLSRGSSVFLVDPNTLAANLQSVAWVRSASVQTALPNIVRIEVAEWQPVAMYRAGAAGRPFYLTERGIAMEFDGRSGRNLDIEGPGSNEPHAGDRVLDPQLLSALVAITRSFPQLFGGQQVASYHLDGCGNLVLVTARGWQVQFGESATPAGIASLRDKLAALKAVAGVVDLRSPTLDYVNVMNPDAPAVHRKGSRSTAFSPVFGSGSITINAGSGGIAVQPCQ